MLINVIQSLQLNDKQLKVSVVFIMILTQRSCKGRERERDQILL